MAQSREQGGLGRGIGASIPGRSASKPAKSLRVSSVESATPSSVNFGGVKYTVKEVRGNKWKITDPKTKSSITIPKGTGITAQDIKFMKASQVIKVPKMKRTEGTRITTFKRGK